jgi:hypothetical protein
MSQKIYSRFTFIRCITFKPVMPISSSSMKKLLSEIFSKLVLFLCYSMMGWWFSSIATAQEFQLSALLKADSRSGIIKVPKGDLPDFTSDAERLYKIEALSFKALDETGIDDAGDDEVMVGTSDAKGFMHSNIIGSIDSGDTHSFDPARSCMLPVRPGEGKLGFTSICDEVGESAPLKVSVELWEQDSDFSGFCQELTGLLNHSTFDNECLHGGADDFIGRSKLNFSSEELEIMLPNVGDEHIETVKLNHCGADVCDVTYGPDYNFTFKITRLPDGLPRPVGLFISSDGNGNIPPLKQHKDWDLDWSQIVPGNFGGDSHTDLLFYKRRTGEALFASTDGNGNISTIKQYTDWDKNWDLIIPGNFGGDTHTDLLLYKRSTGEALFMSPDGNGNLTTINQYTNWDKNWDLIIPGNFDGDSYTDLLLYKRSTGEGLFVSTDGNGNITTINQYTNWDKNWDLIIPGNFDGDNYTDLFLYKRSTGEGLFVSTGGNGNMTIINQYTNWDKNWDLIIPGNFDGDSYTDLLLYKSSTGEGLFVSTDGKGNIPILKQYTDWYQSWNLIVPGEFGGNSNSDLLFYDYSGY